MKFRWSASDPLLGRLVSGQAGWEQLDRDVPIQPRVMRRVDDAYAPLPSWETITYGPSVVPEERVIDAGGDHTAGLVTPYERALPGQQRDQYVVSGDPTPAGQELGLQAGRKPLRLRGALPGDLGCYVQKAIAA